MGRGVQNDDHGKVCWVGEIEEGRGGDHNEDVVDGDNESDGVDADVARYDEVEGEEAEEAAGEGVRKQEIQNLDSKLEGKRERRIGSAQPSRNFKSDISTGEACVIVCEDRRS
eukprot:753826-Hanusia_phi.AAC.1